MYRGHWRIKQIRTSSLFPSLFSLHIHRTHRFRKNFAAATDSTPQTVPVAHRAPTSRRSAPTRRSLRLNSAPPPTTASTLWRPHPLSGRHPGICTAAGAGLGPRAGPPPLMPPPRQDAGHWRPPPALGLCPAPAPVSAPPPPRFFSILLWIWLNLDEIWDSIWM
jgi:hypothetical protein